MGLLLTGLAVFFAAHLLPVFKSVKQTLLGAIGQVAYVGIFSLLSLVGLIIIAYGYGDLRVDGSANPVFWVPPTWMKHVVFLLMIPSFIFIVAAYVPSRIRDALKHPMLVGIKIWAFAHLLANGDLASMILFGSFLAYAVIDRISVKKRAAAGISDHGSKSNQTGGGLTGDITVIVIGLLAYAFMLIAGHHWLIGIPLINS